MRPPIFTWRSERSSTISQLDQGWFSQELGPEIKSTHQGLKRTAQPKKMGWPYPHIWCWVTLVTPLMQGIANVNSVEPPLAPRKQRIKTTPQTWLMITTERQYFMKAEKNSQLSLIHWPTRVSNAKCHKHKHKYTQINEDFLKNKGRYYYLA
jgi:hypothetical protein